MIKNILMGLVWVLMTMAPARAWASSSNPGGPSVAPTVQTAAYPMRGAGTTRSVQRTTVIVRFSALAVPLPVPPPPASHPPATSPTNEDEPTMTAGDLRFARFPYAEDDTYVARIQQPQHGWGHHPWGGNVSVDGVAFGLHTGAFRVRGQLYAWRLGVDTDFAAIFESSKPTLLGVSNVSFAPVLRPQVIWRVGAGLAYLRNPEALGGVDSRRRRGVETGGNLFTSIDIFPVSPVVLSGRVDFGLVGRGHDLIPVLHTQATLGVIADHCEVYGGLDYRLVGDVSLVGPTMGIRVWF